MSMRVAQAIVSQIFILFSLLRTTTGYPFLMAGEPGQIAARFVYFSYSLIVGHSLLETLCLCRVR